MAGNTRGRLKERFESIHRDMDWAKQHCAASLVLIQEHNPNLSEAISSLATGIDTLDELAQNIYGRL